MACVVTANNSTYSSSAQRSMSSPIRPGAADPQHIVLRQQFGFGSGCRKTVHDTVHADLAASGDFVPHVHLRRRIFADQHHGKPRRNAARLERCDVGRDTTTDFFGKYVAINANCGHGVIRIEWVRVRAQSLRPGWVRQRRARLKPRRQPTQRGLRFRRPLVLRPA